MRCRFFLSLNHRVADSVALKLNGVEETPHRSKPAIESTPLKIIAPLPRTSAHIAVVIPINRRINTNHLTTQLDPSWPEDSPSPKDANFMHVRPSRGAPRLSQADPLPLIQVPQCANMSPMPSSPPLDSSRTKLANSPKGQIDPQPPSTSEQVWNLLDANNSDSEDNAMAWSPGRYGRNPGSKRSAGASNSSCKNFAEYHSPEKKAPPSTQDSSQPSRPSFDSPYTPPPVPTSDSPLKIHILYDKAPAEAFKEIEDKTSSSQSDLRLDLYASLAPNLSSSNLTQRSNRLVSCSSTHLSNSSSSQSVESIRLGEVSNQNQHSDE